MWLKTSCSRNWSNLVNLDKTHSVGIHANGEAFTVEAYLDDGGFRNIAHQTVFNKARLFSGTHDECEEYFTWLTSEMNADYWIVEKKEKEI